MAWLRVVTLDSSLRFASFRMTVGVGAAFRMIVGRFAPNDRGSGRCVQGSHFRFFTPLRFVQNDRVGRFAAFRMTVGWALRSDVVLSSQG